MERPDSINDEWFQFNKENNPRCRRVDNNNNKNIINEVTILNELRGGPATGGTWLKIFSFELAARYDSQSYISGNVLKRLFDLSNNNTMQLSF